MRFLGFAAAVIAVAVLSTDENDELQPGLGVQARIGLHFGELRPARRKMFSAHVLGKADVYFNDSAAVMFGGMLGYDAM